MKLTWQDVEAHNAKVFAARFPEKAAKIADDAISAGTEKNLHRQIESHLKELRWLYIHSRTDQPTTQAKGVPDFVCFPPQGRALFIECKTRVGKLSPEQRAFQFVAQLSGYRYEIVRSMQDFNSILTDLNL